MATNEWGQVDGPTGILASGYYFDFDDPTITPILLSDVAWGLAFNNRWGGQTVSRASGKHIPFSVAQHCVHGLAYCEPELKLPWLMHEGVEFIGPDMLGPLKQAVPQFKEIENRINAQLWERWHLPHLTPEMRAELKAIDKRMMATERRDLTSWHGETWAYIGDAKPFPETIVPWTANRAARNWINAFNRLAPPEVKRAFFIAEQVAA